MVTQVRNKGQSVEPNKPAAFSSGVQQEPAPTDLSSTNLKSSGPVPVKPTRVEIQAKVAGGAVEQQLKLQVKANQIKALGRTVTARTTEQAKRDGERALQDKRKAEDVAKKQASDLRKTDNRQRNRQQRQQRNQEKKEKLQQQQANVARVEAQDNIQLGFLGRVMNMLNQSLTAKAEVKTTTSTTSDVEAAQIAQKGTHVGERESEDRLDSVIRPEDEEQGVDAGSGSLGIDEAVEGGSVALEGPVQGGMASSEIFMQQQMQKSVSAELEGELNLSDEFIKFFLDLLSFPEIQKLLQERMALEAAAIMRAVLFQLIEKLQAAGIDPQLSKLLSSVNSGEYPVTTNQVSELMNLLANQVQRVDVQQVLREIDTMDDPDERTVPIYRSKPSEEYAQKEAQSEEVPSDNS